MIFPFHRFMSAGMRWK